MQVYFLLSSENRLRIRVWRGKGGVRGGRLAGWGRRRVAGVFLSVLLGFFKVHWSSFFNIFGFTRYG